MPVTRSVLSRDEPQSRLSFRERDQEQLKHGVKAIVNGGGRVAGVDRLQRPTATAENVASVPKCLPSSARCGPARPRRRAPARSHHSQLRIIWLALTALAMFTLAYGKPTPTSTTVWSRPRRVSRSSTVYSHSRCSSALPSTRRLAGGGPTHSPPSSSSTTASAKGEPRSSRRPADADRVPVSGRHFKTTSA
jgi:hypothetical protein